MLASHEAAEAGGPLGQASMQSSELVMEPRGSLVSTNSGWMVVEWMPSLWKNSFTFSATWNKHFLGNYILKGILDK